MLSSKPKVGALLPFAPTSFLLMSNSFLWYPVLERNFPFNAVNLYTRAIKEYFLNGKPPLRQSEDLEDAEVGKWFQLI